MKILIIEDEEKLASILKRGFEKYGFAADYITDGETGETRAFMCRNDYDVLILDLMLPGKSGMEILQNLRREKISLPVLVLTARDSLEDKVKLLDMGADDYVVKPFAFDELLARVRALLRRPLETLPEVLEFGDLRLNEATREVYQNSNQIYLTLKEFGILQFLMRHPNQVIKRDQLLEHLWDFNFDSFSNIIDVHIKNLRKKLGYGKNQKILETVRGVGYRLRR